MRVEALYSPFRSATTLLTADLIRIGTWWTRDDHHSEAAAEFAKTGGISDSKSNPWCAPREFPIELVESGPDDRRRLARGLYPNSCKFFKIPMNVSSPNGDAALLDSPALYSKTSERLRAFSASMRLSPWLSH